ncbi:hypothetical protein MRX96_049446 [Rhipicephalus microplus]
MPPAIVSWKQSITRTTCPDPGGPSPTPSPRRPRRSRLAMRSGCRRPNTGALPQQARPRRADSARDPRAARSGRNTESEAGCGCRKSLAGLVCTEPSRGPRNGWTHSAAVEKRALSLEGQAPAGNLHG